MEGLYGKTEEETTRETTDDGTPIIPLWCGNCMDIRQFVGYTSESGELYPWCVTCYSTWSPHDITKEQVVAPGVDINWLHANWTQLAGEGDTVATVDTAEKLSDQELYCINCKRITKHIDTHSKVVTEEWECVSCKRRRCDYGKQTNNHFRDCHHWRDTIQVGQYTVTVSASSDGVWGRAHKADALEPDYGLYLANTWAGKVVVTPDFPRASNLIPLNHSYPKIIFDWVDYSTPRPTDLLAVFEWVKEQIRDGARIDLGCFGGHGRTGTFLALLIMEFEGLSPADATQAVWDRHCKEAIETVGQENFIYTWAGQEPPVRTPTKVWTAYKSKANGQANGNSGSFKYASRAEKRQAKASRKRNRRNFRDFAEAMRDQADKQSIKWEVYLKTTVENKSTYWHCEACWHWMGESSIKEAGKSAKIKRECSECQETREFQRPFYLYEDTRTSGKEKLNDCSV